jgi:hypothetical protein
VTSSLDLLNDVVAAIADASTDAEDRVYAPGDWPSQSDQYPIIKARLMGEDRQAAGRGGPSQFTTVATVRLVGEVSELADVNDAGAPIAEAALWQLKRQIDVAVINSMPLNTVCNVLSMRSQLAFNSDAATHLAGVQIDLALEFFEGPEDFAQPATVDVTEVHADVSGFAPVGFTNAFPA